MLIRLVTPTGLLLLLHIAVLLENRMLSNGMGYGNVIRGGNPASPSFPVLWPPALDRTRPCRYLFSANISPDFAPLVSRIMGPSFTSATSGLAQTFIARS